MSIPFVQAKFYTPVGSRQVIWLVLHDMQAPNKGGIAAAVANYFATIGNLLACSASRMAMWRGRRRVPIPAATTSR